MLATACRLTEPPWHTSVGVAETDRVPAERTVTTTLAVLFGPVQFPGFEPVTRYVVFCDGVAVTEAPFVLLSEDEGLHVKFAAPDAVSIVELPRHKLTTVGLTVTNGYA